MYKRYLEPSSSALSGNPTKYILKKVKLTEKKKLSVEEISDSDVTQEQSRNTTSENALQDEAECVRCSVESELISTGNGAEEEVEEIIDESDEVSDFEDSEDKNCEVNTDDDEFFNNINDEFIHPNLNCKISDAVLMILSFFLRHRLTWVALEDMLTLFDSMIGNESRLPKTKYLFQKLFGANTDASAVFHFYCKLCHLYIDTYDSLLQSKKIKEEVTCLNCNTVLSLDKMNDGIFFIQIPIRAQLEKKIAINNILAYNTESNSDCITDIFDGELYKSLKRKIGNGKLLTLTMNTDGVRVFKSKRKSSFWPLQFFINEIHPSQRFKLNNIILSGIWYGKDPDFHLFLKPFTDELNDLNVDKILVVTGNTSIEVNVRVLFMSADSPARCKILAMKQFNGDFGCTYCLHPGTVLQQTTNNNRKYSVFPKYEYTARTHKETLKLMNEFFVNGEVINGILGVSPLIALQDFDIIDGTPIDYFHNLLEGVTDQLNDLWFDSNNHSKDFYISPQGTEIVNKNIKCIKPLKSFTKNPRPIEDKAFWKGNELHKWLLFYGIPCLKGVLKEKYLKHFALLAESTYTLLKTRITPADLNKATINLKQFVVNFENFYGVDKMFYNVHLVTHLVKCVVKCGPMWGYSNFNFESNNGVLVKNVNGTTDVEHQILSKYVYRNVLEKLKNNSEKTMEYIDKVTSTRVRHSKKLGQITLLKKPFKQLLLPDEQKILHQESIVAYNSFFYLNDVFFSQNYKRVKQTNDTFVRLNNGSFGQIIVIFENDKNMVSVLLKKICVERDVYLSHLNRVIQTQVDTYTILTAEEVCEKCLVITTLTESYISVLPNRFESD